MNKKKLSRRAAFLVVIFCIIVFVFAVAIVNRDNISALIKALSYTEVEIENMVNESREKLELEISQKLPDMVSNFTPEEEEKIMKGEITVEDAVKHKLQEFKEKKESSKNEEKNDFKGNIEKAPKGNKETYDEKTAEIASAKIVEFYSLKAYYLGQLGQLEAKVIADYSALPDSKKNLVGKKEVAGKYMSVANSLLVQCDSRVATLLGELEKELKAAGGDLSIITTIKNAYENEKNLKKAYYMSKLK